MDRRPLSSGLSNRPAQRHGLSPEQRPKNMRFNSPRISRRRFLLLAALATPALACADAEWIEPQWVKVRTIKITSEKPRHRIIHITDIHHKGDRPYLESVVRKVNALSPDRSEERRVGK